LSYADLLSECMVVVVSVTIVRKFNCIVCTLSLQIDCKLEPVPADDSNCEINLCPIERPKTNCTIFLGYTSNIISSGVREVIRYLAQHNMVSHHWALILYV